MRIQAILPVLAAGVSLLVGCEDDGDHTVADADSGADELISDAAGDAPFTPPSEWIVAVDETPLGAMMSVWGTSTAQLWAVGGQLSLSSSPGSRAVLALSSDRWDVLDVPTGGMLNWVHGSGELAWMVGEGGRALRWDNGEFVDEVQTPTTSTLWGVWCASESACWSVGGDPRRTDSTPVMVAWDGTSWTLVELPPTERRSRALFKVWGTSASDIHAVGALGLTYHFDGTSWREVESGVREDLISLWGRSSDDVVAVGGRINGVVGRWGGESWEFVELERTPGLNGVWMAPTGDAWLAGANGRLLLLAAGGFDVTTIESPTLRVLHAIYGGAGDRMVAVGGSLDGSLPWTGVVVEGR